MAVYSFTWGSFQSKVNELCLKLADKQQLIIILFIRIYWRGCSSCWKLTDLNHWEGGPSVFHFYLTTFEYSKYSFWIFFLLAQMVNEEYQTWKREKYICIIIYMCVFSAKEEFPNKWVCLDHSWSLFILFILGWKCVLCY